MQSFYTGIGVRLLSMDERNWLDSMIENARIEASRDVPLPEGLGLETIESAPTDLVLDWLWSLPKCEKGCCLTPATRYATYYSYLDTPPRPAAFHRSCDRHGTEPIVPLQNAAIIRAGTQRFRLED